MTHGIRPKTLGEIRDDIYGASMAYFHAVAALGVDCDKGASLQFAKESAQAVVQNAAMEYSKNVIAGKAKK